MENILEKGEIVQDERFHRFPQCFPEAFFIFHQCVIYICSAQSRNRENSRIVPDKVGILTLSGEVGIPTWHGSIPEFSLRKEGIGTKLESIVSPVQSRNRG